MIRPMPEAPKQQPEWKLGPKLTAALNSLGWTERQLADQANVSIQTVNNFKRGYAAHGGEPFRPRAANVIKVARTLRAGGAKVNVKEWLRDVGHDPSTYDEDSEDNNPRGRRLVDKYDRLLPNEQRIVEELVDALLLAHGYVPADEPVDAPIASHYEFMAEGVQSTWEVQESNDRQRVPD
jgi:transcriptional regulator with XRE-family HTH domain